MRVETQSSCALESLKNCRDAPVELQAFGENEEQARARARARARVPSGDTLNSSTCSGISVRTPEQSFAATPDNSFNGYIQMSPRTSVAAKAAVPPVPTPPFMPGPLPMNMTPEQAWAAACGMWAACGMLAAPQPDPNVPGLFMPTGPAHLNLVPPVAAKAPAEVREEQNVRKELGEMKTTVMLRNIPNKFNQARVLHEIECHGFGGSYDFFYLPIDFKKRQNMGYCFVNIRQPDRARDFVARFRKLKLDPASPKRCEASFARVQGLDANIEMYRNSPIAGVAIKAYRPLVFGPDGKEREFPKPDVPLEFLPPVQLRQDRM